MNENNETRNDVQDDPLNGLPEKERKETQEIIDDLEKEGKEKKPDDQDKKPETKPSDDKKPDDPAKPDDKKPDDKGDDKGKKSDDGDDTQRRDPKLIPAWEKKKAEAEWQKREKELLTEIDTLKTSGKPATKEQGKEIADEIKALAAKFDAEPEAFQELVSVLEKRFGKQDLPEEVKQQLAEIQTIKDDKAREYEDTMFSKDFEKQIVPLLKAEYGDDVPQSTIDKVQAELKGLAYKDEFLKVPYTMIYKGTDSFRGLIEPKKKSAESSKGGFTGADRGGSVNFEDVTEDDIKKMSDEEFEKFTEYTSRKK